MSDHIDKSALHLLSQIDENLRSLSDQLAGASRNKVKADAHSQKSFKVERAEKLSPFQEELLDRGLQREPGPPLPDKFFLKRIIRYRGFRAEIFGEKNVADPAWDMILDLALARLEHRRVSVTSLCIASRVPATTALRWIASMEEQAMFERNPDPLDRRRAYIELTGRGMKMIAKYFDYCGAHPECSAVA